jgi:16S rRNA (guanine527-N7)-methyltransferase
VRETSFSGANWRALAGRLSVSRETLERLEAYRTLLSKWAPRINLIGASTLDQFWDRHVLDSAQLLEVAGPSALRWVDVGTGAGFPGLVIAALLADTPGAHVRLVEPNLKRCAFLREAARALAAPVTVDDAKIEALTPDSRDVFTARAFAPLPRLLPVAAPWADAGARILLLKGEDLWAEVQEASTHWRFQTIETPSLSDPRGRIVEIKDLARV